MSEEWEEKISFTFNMLDDLCKWAEHNFTGPFGEDPPSEEGLQMIRTRRCEIINLIQELDDALLVTSSFVDDLRE